MPHCFNCGYDLSKFTKQKQAQPPVQVEESESDNDTVAVNDIVNNIILKKKNGKITINRKVNEEQKAHLAKARQVRLDNLKAKKNQQEPPQKQEGHQQDVQHVQYEEEPFNPYANLF